MHIWTIEKWKRYIPNDSIQPVSRIYLRADKGVDEDLKCACRAFIRFLKRGYYFPVPIYIYLKNQIKLKALDGDFAVATFFEPDSFADQPYIRIAVGDYPALLASCGRDDAIASILSDIAHELTHYFQWINALKLTDIGRERQARQYANYILSEYSQTCEHP